jgi:hypothetical protein
MVLAEVLGGSQQLRHVAARRLVVRFGDGRWANAELRGASIATDVAVGLPPQFGGCSGGFLGEFWVNCA